MALLFLLGAFALWWVWPRKAKAPSALDQARTRLGLKAHASATEIEAAFRERVRTAHPDVGGSAQETRLLTEARDLLLGSLSHKGH